MSWDPPQARLHRLPSRARGPGHGGSLESGSAAVRIVLLVPGGEVPAWASGLAGLGHEVRTEVARDAAACVDLARREPVDAVVLGPGSGSEGEAVLRALRGEGPPVIVVEERRDDERTLSWVRLGAADCVVPSGEGDGSLAFAVLEQVRERRSGRARAAAARRMQALELVSESVVENMNSAVLVVDRDAQVVVCNAPAGEILGRPAAEILGASARGWFPDARGRCLVSRTLAGGLRFKGAETTLTRDGGSVVPIGISCAPIQSADGTTEGAVATFQDLSEIRQLQRQVLQNEKMASIGQLAAGVAHEINNPMGFIHANLFQMAEYVGDLRRVWQQVEPLTKLGLGSDDPELRRAAERLAELSQDADVPFVLGDLAKAIRESQEGSERIRHIVADLRDFSHQDNGERMVADLNQCVDSTANIVWPMMKHLVVLERHYEDLPAVSCYPMQLKQVFMNLLVNAYQAIEAAPRASGGTRRVELHTRRAGDRVVVSVSDTGIGIDPAHLDRIFDPFFTTKRVGSGTGLGLSTSYAIVQRHGGTIEVDSVPGEGATFQVILPVDGDAE